MNTRSDVQKSERHAEQLDSAKRCSLLFTKIPNQSQNQTAEHESATALIKRLQAIIDDVELIPPQLAAELIDQMLADLTSLQLRMCSEALPLPTDYPRFPELSATDPLTWLETHWGPWLKFFTPSLSRDHLYLDQLGELDPALKKALYAKRRRILRKTGRTISQIIPKKSVRLDRQIEEADPASLRAAVRTYTLPRMRKIKSI